MLCSEPWHAPPPPPLPPAWGGERGLKILEKSLVGGGYIVGGSHNFEVKIKIAYITH